MKGFALDAESVTETEAEPETLESLNDEIMGWFEDYAEQARPLMELRRECKDFRDGNQWSQRDLEKLNSRKQPPIVINFIGRKVDYIKGHEQRTRTDPKALPRTPQHDRESEAITDALRYVFDRENFDQIGSETLEELTVEAQGAVLIEAETTTMDVPVARDVEKMGPVTEIKEMGVIKQQTDIKLRLISADRYWHDVHSSKKDFSDATYHGIVSWMHEEKFKELYGDDEELADAAWHSAQGNDAGEMFTDKPDMWFDRENKRARVIECYYLKGRDWYVCHLVRGKFMVTPRPTGIQDDRTGHHICPLVPVSAFVDADNGRYPLVRQWLSPQEMINKYNSKALHFFSARQVKYEAGAVLDPQKASAELSKPDGMVEVHPGMQFEILPNNDLAMGHLQLLQGIKQDFAMLGPGQTEGNSTDQSGRLFLAKEQAATQELEPIFDVFRHWKRRVARVVWLFIRTYWREEKWFRVTDDAQKTGFRFVGLNRRITKGERFRELTEQHGMDPLQALASLNVPQLVMMGQQLLAQAQQAGQNPQAIIPQLISQPEMQEVLTMNDVSQIDVDIILDVSPDSATVQHEQFLKLANLAQQGFPIPPEVVIKASGLRNKQEILQAMQGGQQNAAAMQMQQQQMQAQMQLMAAQVAKMQAETQAVAAKAQRDLAQAQLVPIEAQAKQAKAAVEMARAQIGIPAEARKDEAIALRHGIEAGGELAAPDQTPGDGHPPLAVPEE